MEHAAEAIGEDLAAREQRSRAVAVMGKPVPILYVQIDGTGVPVVKKQTDEGKRDGESAQTPETKLGRAFTQTSWDAEGYGIRCAVLAGGVPRPREAHQCFLELCKGYDPDARSSARVRHSQLEEDG